MVVGGRSHPDLAQRIAEQLGVEQGEIELKTYPNGETYVRYNESIRGADLFLVQTGCEPVDQNLMELLLMIQAAKLASAKRITAVIPWFPYSRQDRKAKPREPISGRLVADMLQLAGADRVLTMDLHAGQIQGFFTIPVDHMTAQQLFARHFRDLGLHGEGVVSVAPDAGRAKVAVRFAEMLDADFAVIHKTRHAGDQVSVTEVTGRVRGKTAIVGDDVTTTGSTLVAGARALRDHGVEGVWIYVTHALLNDEGLERLRERRRHRRDRRHRHRAARPEEEAGQHDGAHRGAAARGDDHERLRRRFGFRNLRRREPTLLGAFRGKCSALAASLYHRRKSEVRRRRGAGGRLHALGVVVVPLTLYVQVDAEEDQRPQEDREDRRQDRAPAVDVREIVMCRRDDEADADVDEREQTAPEHRGIVSAASAAGTWRCVNVVRSIMRGLAWRAPELVGSQWMFPSLVFLVALWLVIGPVFHFSGNWLLIPATATSILAFLLVALLQYSQNRDTRAIQLKLDELIRSLGEARTDLVRLQELSDEELDELEEEFRRLRSSGFQARSSRHQA